MILDDGGDATLLVHKGVEFEKAGAVPAAARGRRRGVRRHPRPAARARSPRTRSAGRTIAAGIKGVTEETTTGVHRLLRASPQAGTLLFPAINVNDSVTKSKFDNKYGIRHSLLDGINRAHRRPHRRQGRGRLPATATSARAAPRRCAARAPASSSPRSTRSARCRRRWTATRSPRWRTSSAQADIFVTATGNKDVVTAEHMGRMKHQAILGNIGHFDNEIDMAGLAAVPGRRRDRIKPQVRRVALPRRAHASSCCPRAGC